MQTFMPYSNYFLSAAVLDRSRLGKQRVECLQIAKAISDPGYGWQSHPAVNMWRNDPRGLYLYATAIVRAWRMRGYRDGGTLQKIQVAIGERIWDGDNYPFWMGDDAVHSSHRAALLAKDFEHYSQWGWLEEPKIAYVWPTKGEFHVGSTQGADTQVPVYS
jgi:hypothetical protein